MEIDVRAVRKLRDSAGAQAAFGPLVRALCASDADLTSMRVVCDWIQYKNNFRDTAMVRPVLSPDGLEEGYELAVDLRRCARPGADVAAEVTAALADAPPAAAGGPPFDGAGGLGGTTGDRVWLEPWVSGSGSCVWRFNALY